MINNFVCADCNKKIVCEWCKTVTKKFDADSKSAYDMEITINHCEEFMPMDKE